MVSKKQLLLKSIRELLALNVSDQEILMNLKEVGVDNSQGKKLLEEAKKPAEEKEDSSDDYLKKFAEAEKKKPVEEKEAEETEKEAEIEKEREAATEELASEVAEPEEKPASFAELSKALGNFRKRAERKKEAREREGPVSTPKISVSSEPKIERRIVEDVKVSKLWEKGILATVNNRLEEMKELKEEIDSVLDQKIEEATRREMEKIKVLFDSQRTLLVSKVDAEIETKAKGFVDMISLKLKEMREINRGISGQIEQLEQAQQKAKADEESLLQRLEEVDKVKQGLVASLNSEIIKSKTDSKAFVEEMNQKLSQMDDRINKTLELENQIVEGLVRDAEQRVEKMMELKSEEVSKAASAKLDELKQMKAGFESEQQKKLQEIEAQFKDSMAALDNQIKQRLAKLDELQDAVTVELDPKKIKAQTAELKEFKNQFVSAIKENVEKFNQGIEKLNEKTKVMEDQFLLRIEKIDKKIAELDAFEKAFAEEMGLAIEKMSETGKKKKS
jgi:hypothetical protein